MIISEKLVGSENYLSWSASVELWFMGQGYEDHLVMQEADIPEVDKVQWRKIDAQLCSVLWQSVDPKILHHLWAYKTCFKFWNQAKGLYTNDIQRLYKIASLKEEFLTVMPLTTDVGDQRIQIDKFFMVLTLIGPRLDLETVRDQILGNSSVLVSQTNSRGGRSGNRGRGQRPHCTYCNKFDHTRDRCYQLHGRPPRTAHVAQSFDPQSPQPPSSSTSQGIFLTDSEYDDYLRYQATKSASVASVAQTGFGFAHPLPSLPLHSVLYALSDRSTRKTIGIGRESQGLYHLTSPSPAVCISTDAPLLIHSRLGHPSLSKFQKMVPSFSSLSSLACESCQLGKHTRVSFPKRLNNRAKSPFELVHTDVWGPCRTASTLGFQYFVTFIDDYSRCTCDNAREYFSTSFTSFMSQHGIIHQSSCAHTPQQNGIPHSLLFPDQPLYFLPPRVFGCTCFVHILTPGQDKLSARATKCIFLRYSRLQKGYRCYSSETHCYFLSADVTFFEDSPFFSTSESLPVSEVLLLPIISPPDAVPSRPLQVYHCCHRVAVPPSLVAVPADSPPIPLASPAPTLPPSADLPIALQKGNRSIRNPHPIYNFLSYYRLSSPYSAFVSAISSVSLPKSTPEALSHLGWRQAMVDEMAALHSNGTWDLVVLPSGKSTVGCRWVYTVKVGPDSQVDRLKARLVAKGYTQVYGSDYGDTFSPVAKIVSVRLLLCMAAMRSWPLYQLDIKNAFLHGDLAEEVYMEQPPGFVAQEESGLVCRLRRSLYGLKQSPRVWFSRFSSVVQEFGMFRSSDQNGIQNLKQHLFTRFQTKDLGKLKYFLGIEIAQFSSGVVLSQRKYALDILEETGMLDCKPVDTPMDPITPGQGVLYENRGHTQVVGYTDADWAGSPTDRRSTSGYCVFIGGNLISWKSKKQDVVARSSAEAEYRAMALATCELIWLKHLLRELRFGKDEQMKLICDNQAALHIASNPVFHERTKHIEVDCRFIKKKIVSGCVTTSFVNSNDKLADIFTKSLRGPRIKYICNKLGAYNIYAPA
ncbi:Retrovirus-related Pol polyprotein from transposon RE2 [Vitis vinifera]|uniref:Retrovirus-related Pol polyprotein from transposon RE2 n=1 Tax=Vitis vinifera TaxID=29760 RepID=A0A438KH75_VITVI|nr:Retrovirus-related Pol polyprotein from transposon RE2 [Vitis vinifera]